MKQCTARTPTVKPQCSAEFFTHEPDGREWMIAFASDEQPTAQELRDLLGGVAHDLEIVDAEGCDEAEVEIVEPARGHDCALLVRSSYVELTCTVLGMVVKRLADAGVQFAHQGCWPSKPVEIQDAQYRNRARDPEALRQCAEQKANIAHQLLDEAKALTALTEAVART